MIPHVVEPTKCVTNMEGGTNFTIKASSKMFRILSSGLYSNKIKAVIREVSCNAVDANVDAGNADVPIIVHLPNEVEPHFSIKDQGTGLTPEQMTDIYTSYGTSTKTDRNDQIGALGLGSKSPFSYVDQFTVTTVVDGVKYSYSAFLNGDGEPRLQPFGDGQPTDEPNGLEVSFPVNSDDFYSFKQEAEIVFRPFVVQPTIVGNSNCKIKSFTVQLEGADKDWQLVKDDSESWRNKTLQVAVQGNIEYPINTHLIENHVQGTAAKLLQENFRLTFPIGDLDIAASREELGYDKTTIDNIVAKIKKVADEIENSVSKKLESYDTLYEARSYLSDMRKDTKFYGYFKYNFDGESITDEIEIPEKYHLVHYFKKTNGHIKRVVSKSSYNDKFSFTVPSSESKTIFVYDDEGKKGKAVTKARSLANANSKVYLIPNEDEELVEILGYPDVKFTSDIEMPNKVSSTAGVSRVGRHFKVANLSYSSSSYWFEDRYEEADDIGLDLSEEFYYVKLYRGGMDSYSDIDSIRKIAVHLGYIDENAKVYGVNRGYARTKKFKELDAIDFVEEIGGKLKRSRKLKNIISIVQKENELSAHENAYSDNFLTYIKNELLIEKLGVDSPFKKAHDDWKELKVEVMNNKVLTKCIKSLRYFLEIDDKLDDYEVNVDTRWTKKYPLLSKTGYVRDKSIIIEYIQAIDFYKSSLEIKATQEV